MLPPSAWYSTLEVCRLFTRSRPDPDISSNRCDTTRYGESWSTFNPAVNSFGWDVVPIDKNIARHRVHTIVSFKLVLGKRGFLYVSAWTRIFWRICWLLEHVALHELCWYCNGACGLAMRGSIPGCGFQSPTPKPLGNKGTWMTQSLTLGWLLHYCPFLKYVAKSPGSGHF